MIIRLLPTALPLMVTLLLLTIESFFGESIFRMLLTGSGEVEVMGEGRGVVSVVETVGMGSDDGGEWFLLDLLRAKRLPVIPNPKTAPKMTAIISSLNMAT